MKKIVALFAVFLNVNDAFTAQLRTNCLENGGPNSDVIDLSSLLDSKPDGYTYKVRHGVIDFRNTHIIFQTKSGKRGLLIEEDQPEWFWSSFSEPPQVVAIAMTDDGIATVSVNGRTYFDYHRNDPQPIKYVQFNKRYPYGSHTIFHLNCTSNESLQCGKRAFEHDSPLTSGFETQEGDWPWHTAIWYTDQGRQTYICSGTLITPDAVLTAAHCLFLEDRALDPDRVIVQIGKHSLQLSSPRSQEFRSKQFIIHNDYDSNTYLNDIAIIRLPKDTMFTAYVRPVCLSDANRLASSRVIGKKGVAVGWGFNEGNKLSDDLVQAFLPVVNPSDCLESYPDYSELLLDHNTTFCSELRNVNGARHKDSGGGMYFIEKGSYTLRGIISQMKAKEYAIVTDTAPYLEWIRENSK